MIRTSQQVLTDTAEAIRRVMMTEWSASGGGAAGGGSDGGGGARGGARGGMTRRDTTVGGTIDSTLICRSSPALVAFCR